MVKKKRDSPNTHPPAPEEWGRLGGIFDPEASALEATATATAAPAPPLADRGEEFFQTRFFISYLHNKVKCYAEEVGVT